MEFEFNEAAFKDIAAAIGQKIEATDRSLRERHVGEPVEDVLPAAREAFTAIGVDLPEEDLRAYAEAVSENDNFKFVLG